METTPTPIGKHKLLASASVELLLESDDDKKEFSELQNSQITVAQKTVPMFGYCEKIDLP